MEKEKKRGRRMNKTNEREYRALSMSIRARDKPEDGEKVVNGYAATFNQPYELYRDGRHVIKEQIDAKAFDECDLEDVIMQFDHNGRVYARTRNGTLRLSIDGHGLAVEADLSRTEAAKQLYEEIREGMIDRMSYGFIVEKDEWTDIRDESSGTIEHLRTVRKVRKVYDVSAVSIPANDKTSISARSIGNEMIEKIENERRKAARAKLALKIRMMGV